MSIFCVLGKIKFKEFYLTSLCNKDNLNGTICIYKHKPMQFEFLKLNRVPYVKLPPLKTRPKDNKDV